MYPDAPGATADEQTSSGNGPSGSDRPADGAATGAGERATDQGGDVRDGNERDGNERDGNERSGDEWDGTDRAAGLPSTGDPDDAQAGPTVAAADPAAGLPPTPPRRRGSRATAARRRRSGRHGLRVTQRLWSVSPWSVFKVSVLFYICMFVVVLVAATVLWNVGRSVGTIDSVESFVTRLGAYGSCTAKADVPEGVEFETDDDCREGEVLVGGFQIDDGTLLRATAIAGGIMVVAGSLATVLMTVLLNLLNEVVGGVRHTVVAEPVGRRRDGSPRPPPRR